MSVFKATKNRKEEGKESTGGTFKATQNRSYDSTMLYEWEKANKDSVATLNAFTTKSNNNEYLSSDDLDAYRKALDSYIESSNNLRGVTKSLGGTLDDDDATWESKIASMNSAYEETQKHYGKWKNEKAYKKNLERQKEQWEAAKAAQKEREGMLAYDFVAGEATIKDLESTYNEAMKIVNAINERIRLLQYGHSRAGNLTRLTDEDIAKDSVIAQLREQLAPYGDVDALEKELGEKKRYHTLAGRLQNAEKLASVVGNEDFEENSQYESTVAYYRTAWDDFVNNPSRLEYDDATYEAINRNEDVRADIAREDRIYSSDNPWDDGRDWFEESNYAHMNDTEIAIYNYYYKTEGKEKAEEFLDSIQETLNYRSAEKQFGGLEDHTFLEMVFAVEAGLDQFKTGIESLFSNADYINQSDTQMLSGMVRDDLADNGATLPDWLGGASLGQVAYDSITTTSNMLPSIMVSFVPVVGQAAGAVTLGASAAGHAKAEMLNLGYSKAQANTYGLMVGASEAGLQYLLGGITKLGGKAPQGLTKLALSKVDNAMARVAVTLGMNMASEGLEESLQTVIEPWLKSLVTGVDFEAPDIDEVLYSGLLGAVTSLFMEGGTTIAGEVSIRNKGANLKSGEQGAKNVDALVGLGKDFAEGTVANRLANSINENSSAYTIGRLLTEVGGSLSERNIADIASDLQAKGMSPEAANSTAKWLYKAVEGGHFNRRQQKAYLEDNRISDVHRELFTNEEHSVHKRNAEYEALYELAKEVHKVDDTAKAQTKDAPVTTDAPVAEQASAQQTETVSVTENAPKKEIATEGKFEASETGKTTYNGNEVKVQRIESINGKDVMVRLDNGETVNARDIDFGNDEEGLLYEAAVDMDIDSANAFILGYNGAKNAPLAKPMTLDQYVTGFKEARLYGELGIPYEAIARDGKYANDLFESQKKVAYQSGYDYGVKKANDAQAALSRGGAKPTAKAKTPRTYKGETHISEIKKSKVYKSLSDTQKAGIDGMLFLYKALGIDVYFFESPTDKNGKRKGENGYFNPKDGSVHIDLYAGIDGRGLILFTGSHELTHYIRAKLPAKFKIFADALLKQYEANGNSIAERIATKKYFLVKKGRTKGLTEDEINDLAYEEVIADACEAMLANGEAFVQISEEIKAKDKGLWEAIKSFFANLVARIKGEYANLEPDSIVGKKVAEMLETATELQRMWVDMLVEASTQEQFSTDGIRGNADGAVAKSEVTEVLVDSTANDGVLLSTRTEYEALPKQSMSLSTGVGTILHSIEGLKPTLVKGITEKSINGFTGRAVREYAMRNSGFTKKQIGAVNKFMDAMADFMKEAGVTYRFIGLQDVENATLHYTYNPDGSIKSVVLSAMVKNGDYPVNFDLSSICKKREAMSALVRKLAQRGSLDNGTVKLTPANIFKINTALKDAGYETACLGCFVESKRYNSMEWAKKFCDKWNAAVKKVNPNATYFGYGDATFNEDSFTLEQAIKIDDAANKYIKATKTERLANALAKYKAKEQAGQPLVAGKVMKVDGEELNTFSKAARDRLAKSDTISEELKTKYLTCDVSTLTLEDVEFLLENGVLPGASLSNKQAVTEMVKSGEAYQHLLRPSDLLTDRGISKLEALPNFHGVLYGHYGSGTPKLMQGYTPYNSEIALLPANKNNEQTLAEYLYTIAGVRMQSFSDFQIQNIYDYLQMVADLAARRVPAHAYTKEISFAKLLGMTGIKVNLSVMFDIDPMVDEAHAGLTKLNQLVHKGEYAKVVLEDAQGKWVYNIGDYQTQRMFEAAYPDEAKRFLQSIGFADAVRLQSSTGYSANCGIIGVGYSDLGIFAMLDDNRIRYIIPYHASSLPADIKVATRIELGTDYTPYQNNMKIVGIEDSNGNKVNWTIKEAYKRLGSGQAVINELNDKVKNEGWVVTTKKAQTGHGTYGLYEDLQQTNDPRQTASNFMDWCIGNSTLPLFYQFASHENYYKMLYDYNVYDCVTEEYAPQQAVTNTYPTMVDGEVKAGTVTDGGFNADYLQGTIDKQMAFMNQYGENLDSDLEKLADNMEEGRYSLHNGFMFSDRDSDYMDAVNRGDIETAREMVYEAADKALSKSKITNRGLSGFGKGSNELVIVHHATQAKFTVFDKAKIGSGNGGANFGKGFYFSAYRSYVDEYGGDVGDYFLDIRNPFIYYTVNKAYIVDMLDKSGYEYDKEFVESYDEENFWDADLIDDFLSDALKGKNPYNEFSTMLQNAGFDGIVVGGGDEIIAFDSNQIKSADPVTYDDDGNVIPLSERFNTENNDIRYSLREVEPVAPTSDKWQRTLTTSEVKAQFPDLWDVSADESEVRNPTQISGTVRSYRKVYDFLKKSGFKGTILDASSGLGYGTKAGIDEYGFDVEDIEPYPDKSYSPKYTDYSSLDKKYDVIISNAVLNVLPQDQRDALVVKMGELLKDGGRMFINVRGDDVKNASSKVAINEDLMEYYISKSGSYQKGFTKSELVAYLQDALGDGFTVTPTTFFGKTSAVVTKNEGKVLYSDRDPDSVSNRSLLANALESVAQNDVERNKLAEYKGKIALIESEQARLAEVKKQANDIRFTKGRTADETKRMKDLEFEANQIANRINTYDRQLLSLESTKALKGVLEREKQMAYKKAEKKGKEALARQREKAAKTQRELLTRYQESRKKGIERRDEAALRRKIRKVVKDLNSLLKNGNKKRNIKEEMQDTVASSLALADVLFNDDITNEDIVRLGVDSVTVKESEYLNKYRDLLEERDALQAKIETIYGNGLVRETLLVEVGKVTEELDKVKGRIAYLNNKLSDLFERERARLNRATIDTIINDLVTEYSKLETSENGYIKNAYSEAMKKRLETLKEALQGKIARDMDIYQLSELYDTFKSIEHMVRHSNNLFREGRLEDLMTYVSNAQGELYEASTEQKDGGVVANALESAWNEFTWNNLRPVDAFERLGSPTLEKLFWDFVHAMGVAARDITEAGEVIAEAREKYGYSSWNMELADTSFTTRDGLTFKPSLADKLSIYAYSKRDQAEKHMVDGGFTYDTGRTYKETEKGKTYVRRKLSNTYRLSKENIQTIIASLTNEQRDYVDAILPYLTDMGKKGNEVSMTLYGIELFGEKVYFPLQSSKDYLSSTTQTLGATPTMASLANSGFTKQTTPNADNPIVLRGFDDVVLEHIEKMSNYHALVIPIENLRRVFDNVSRDADRNSIATKALIGSRFGLEAQKYFEQWLTDINGGVMSSGAKSPLGKLFSRAKGMSVAANLSVVAQQYFSIVRAMELVDPKYFAPFLNGEAKKTDMKQYEELLKYAPITIIKEMGGFDVGSSGRVKDYIGYEGARKDAKYINKKIDDLSMWGAGQMDKLGWVTIWKAVKAEVASEQNLAPDTDEFYEACKIRFTEVVTKTQVFDSVASRSGYMRSQHDTVKFATSFMGEPTAIVGRLFVASHNLVRAIKSGNKARMKSAWGRFGRVATVIAVSNVLGNLAKSLVYAGREDEDDEALLERWMRNFGEALLDDLNILNSLPFGRDIVSAWEGWDVERPDMTLISDMITSAKKMLDGDITLDDSLNLVGSVGNFFGKPLKNVIREIESIINVIGDITDDVRPTNMGGAFVDGFTGNEKTKTDKLYSAILRGDDDRVKVMKESYDSDSEYNSAVRKALRENDPRIKEAAMAFFEQNHSKRQSLTLEIEKEGKFSPTFVRGAINNEIQYIKNKINDAKAAKKKGDAEEYDKIVKKLRENYPKDFVEKVLGED